MTLDQSLAFLTFSLVAAVTPGPSNVMITATGSAFGLWRGLPCVLGASFGMASLLFCTALGMGQLILGHPLLLTAMNLLGAGFLLWLAWKIATAGPASESAKADPVGFFAAALFQWANPKGWMVAVGAASTYLQAAPGSQIAQAAAFGALFFLAAFPSGLAWLVLGALLQTALRNDRTARIFNRVSLDDVPVEGAAQGFPNPVSIERCCRSRRAPAFVIVTGFRILYRGPPS